MPDTMFLARLPRWPLAGGFYLWRHVFATLEGKLTASFARVPIADGSADVPSLALHGLFGIGAEW